MEHAFKQWREAQGLSLEDVAQKVGVKKVTIHYIESGKTEPRRQLRARLCKLTGLSPVDFLIEEDAT